VTAAADDRLAGWIADHAGLTDVTVGALLAGGNANVTRMVTAREGRFVLRHPPIHAVSEKAAAGIAREFTAVSALAGQAPVPRPIIFCDDADVIGQSFAVLEFVDGIAITDVLPEVYGRDGVGAIGGALVDALGAVHTVDPADLLEQGFGRPAGFARRQVERWSAVRAEHAVRDLPLLRDIGEWLLATVPAEGTPAIVHCDFHLDNCLSAPDRPDIRAVIDWEMATLGDPLVDLGLCLFFWKRNPDAALGFPFVQAISNRADAPEREALADRWSAVTGRDHTALGWHMVFAAWRLAAIVEGAWLLHVEGKAVSDYGRRLEHDVPNLLSEARALIDGGVR
jgi:aminoglycoside phosphotransferase (APT) family kinase protein